jgi:hypothetical protein
MKRINFDNLRKCEALYNIQENIFDFGNSFTFGEEEEFFPMPEKARDLVMVGHYSKPIDESTPEKLKFNYHAYIAGLRVGYSEQLPKTNDAILDLAFMNISLKYTHVDKVCSNSECNTFGVAVGSVYKAWIYIADNIEEFCRLWEVSLIDFENDNKTFADLLNVDDKDMLLKKLHVLIDGFKGKRIAHVLMVLIDNRKIDFRFQNKVYELMRLEFTFETTDESINKYLKYNFDKKDEKEYTLVENALKD